ncbi:hypothetical protein EDD17DRAFT_1644621 [Pisolithus thermaeus]|nr:hypothetical protein EDD17DRAFT_1644621 [Pisolithus thermaeus]
MSSIFGNLSSKFLSVERLSLCDYTELWKTARKTNVESAQAVSAAFPSVRHVELHARHVEAFFNIEAALDVESLFEDEISALKEWFIRRTLEGKPVLDVIILDIPSIFSDSRRSALYESFSPYCNVVVPVDFDLTSGLSLSACSMHTHEFGLVLIRIYLGNVSLIRVPAKLPALCGLSTTRSGGVSFVSVLSIVTGSGVRTAIEGMRTHVRSTLQM